MRRVNSLSVRQEDGRDNCLASDVENAIKCGMIYEASVTELNLEVNAL